jgi:hypothetical protein
MPRKIYDIRPPKMVAKIEKEIKEFLVDGKKKKQKGRTKKEKRPILIPVLVGTSVVVLGIGVYLFFKLPKADVTIWPKVDTLNFTKTITADKSVASVDTAKNVIPAQYFQVSKTSSQDFPATGNASNEGRATGTITIYNKYDPPTPFTLITGTHFMSDSGKLFVASQKIVVPAAKKSGGKITPGSVQVSIKAVEGGTDYNIAPANFSIPGLKGTSYYYSIYATSSASMSGGYSGKVKKVTDDDIQGAKDILTKKATSDAMAALKSQISSEYVLLDNAVLSDVTNASTQTKAETVAENFNYQVTVEASAVAFKKSDIEQFAKNYIISQMPEGKTMLDSSFKIDYSASKIDVSGGKATLDLSFSSGVYQDVDKNSVALSILGKNTNQIKETINNSLGNQVTEIKVYFWPFWVVSAPNSQKAVNIKLKFQ